MGVAGVLLFAGSAFQQLGLYYTKVANASFLTSLYVIFTPFLLWLFFREKPTLTHSFAAFLAVLGAFLLSVGAKFEWQLGDLLEIAGALFWGMHVVIVGKVALRFESISFAVGQFLICAFLNFSLGFFLEDFSKLFTVGVLGATAYRGLLSIGIGYTAQIWAQRFTSPNDAALIFSLEAVFASIVAAFILKESLAPPQLAGCALILLAASLSQLRPKS